VDAVPEWHSNDLARQYALDYFRRQSFVVPFAGHLQSDAAIDRQYLDGFAGYAAWRSEERTLSERCAALQFACDKLADVCRRTPTLARLSILARATWEMGRRSVCVDALRKFGELLQRGENRVDEPFWPANPRFDILPPGMHGIDWFFYSAAEQLERTASFSSLFGGSGINLDWLSQQPFASVEIERRRILGRARVGQRVEVSGRLCVAAPDNVNGWTWRSGRVPNTWPGNSHTPQ
jgi:hypothetical protein